ncbi:hypothetical protein H0H92_007627 [Tricholoma furcatifolium]|nr:hypothetical protein H0H92_007627 [Tricholoma furcatifolium]
MVQKRPRAALRIADEPLSPRLDPYLRMRAADDFRLEREAAGAVCVDRREAEPRAVGEAPDAQRRGVRG